MKTFYVCLKHGIAWMGETQDMQAEYNYGQQIHYFDTEQEAHDYLCFIEASIDAQVDKLCGGYDTGE